jgi:glycosyltransferase involved in cell wall biosynthesis
MENQSLSIIVPAYNEASNLAEVIPQLLSLGRKHQWKIIVVNDGSMDATRAILGKFNDNDNLKVLHHKVNKGYGAAIKTGILASETAFSITYDADGQHFIEDVEALYQEVLRLDADMVIGSRKGLKHATVMRGIGKSIIRIIAKILMPIPVHDINSGMKIFRTDLAKKYCHLAPDTMAFSDTFTLIFINQKHLVTERPIRIRERKNGQSTVGFQTAFQTIMEIINVVILFNPMKIFLSISFLFLIVSLVWGIPIAWQGRGISTGSLLGMLSALFFFLMGLVAEQLSLIRKRQV